MDVQSLADDLAKRLGERVPYRDHSGPHEQLHVVAESPEKLEAMVETLADHLLAEGKSITPCRLPSPRDWPDWRGRSGDVEIRLLHAGFISGPEWRVDVCCA